MGVDVASFISITCSKLIQREKSVNHKAKQRKLGHTITEHATLVILDRSPPLLMLNSQPAEDMCWRSLPTPLYLPDGLVHPALPSRLLDLGEQI